MKLNLLPKSVDVTSKAKKAFLFSTLLFIISLVAAFAMAKISGDRVAAAQAKLDEAKPKYDDVVKIAADADAMMTNGRVKQITVNGALAKAMYDYNDKYIELYGFVKPYIPRFFRITSLTASPIDANSCTVTMTGTVKNAQEYADLMLALLRIPGATTVGRSGFSAEDVIVPPLSEVDQNGRKSRTAGARPPSGFLSSGSFGDTQAGTVKTVRPNESLITVSVTVPKDIRTPDPRATIRSLAGTGSGAAGAAAAAMPAASGMAPAGGKGDQD
ncbi:MAG: hypothetical protein LW628_10525 [Fimbriimonadaceae bacterium]|nr:hypothetical protein [Fimbriimonadaceae bacterium]